MMRNGHVSTLGAALLLSVITSFVGPAAFQCARQDPKSLFDEAQRALLAHDYPKAEHGFREFLRIDPQSVGAYSNLGVVYMRTGRYDQAIKALKQAKKLAPQMAGLDLNLGLAYYH